MLGGEGSVQEQGLRDRAGLIHGRKRQATHPRTARTVHQFVLGSAFLRTQAPTGHAGGNESRDHVPADDAAAPKEDLVTTAPPERPETPPETPVLEIPDGVSERTRTNYERMFKTVRSQLATIESAAKKAPAPCDVAQKDCEAEFRAVADALLDYHQSSRFSYFCPGSSDEAKAFHKTKSHLMRDVQARHSELVQKLEQALSEAGADGKKEWARIEQEAAAARPHPCLSFACEDW